MNYRDYIPNNKNLNNSLGVVLFLIRIKICRVVNLEWFKVLLRMYKQVMYKKYKVIKIFINKKRYSLKSFQH